MAARQQLVDFQDVASAYELPWGRVMAASVIVTVPLILLVLILQRYIV
jgi:trehalose/maltose transport system permease protein